jgi:hypothetical protein
MPNWVLHDIDITGPEVVLSRLATECITEGGLDFNKVAPQPPYVLQSIEDEESREPSWDDPAWYTWRCAHWGTKWPARSGCTKRTPEKIEISFYAANGVTLPIFKELTERYPALTIKVKYVIHGASPDFDSGEVHCHAGQMKHIEHA